MSHEIENRNGQDCMMYTGEVPWHGLGQAVEKEVTAAAAIKLAGMDWTCEKRPLYIAGNNTVDGIPVVGTQVPDRVAIVRNDDNAILGITSNMYHIIQNSECFGFIDEIIGSGQAVFHTAASLAGGRKIFCTVKFPNDAKIGDDLINMYLLLSSSHDGKEALRVQWTPVRVVCANTLSLALGTSTPASINIVHTQNYQKKIHQAREVLRLTDNYYQIMEQEFNKLLDAEFSNDDMVGLTERLFPVKDGKEVAGITKNKREKLVELFEAGAGNAPVHGTKWGAFNAVTEFTDHHLIVRPDNGGSEQEARMSSAVMGGNGSKLKQLAFNVLSGAVA
jgi:phage/plasmid-like protein (TIGR03299 family)